MVGVSPVSTEVWSTEYGDIGIGIGSYCECGCWPAPYAVRSTGLLFEFGVFYPTTKLHGLRWETVCNTQAHGFEARFVLGVLTSSFSKVEI
jgi:hypothetical protein